MSMTHSDRLHVYCMLEQYRKASCKITAGHYTIWM
jgi:hypothetical protein